MKHLILLEQKSTNGINKAHKICAKYLCGSHLNPNSASFFG